MADPDLISEPNDYVLRAARGEVTPRPCVWVHRQAGRYMQEFRDVRTQHDFFTICRTPELACEVTLQPLRKIPYDAAIIFSDILVIPQALGMEVLMVKGEGPHFPSPLRTPEDIERLKLDADVARELSYVGEAIRLTRSKLGGRIPLLGFSGAPWTLMAYMIEGGGSKTLSKAKAWLYKYPGASKRLLEILEDAIVDYLWMQIESGAQMLEVFDTWAEYLSPVTFNEFVIPGLRRIASRVKSKCIEKGIAEIPMTLFAKGANQSLEALSRLQYNVLSIDWTIEPAEARRLTGGRVALQGNLDPCVLYGSNDTIHAETIRMLDSFGPGPLIANLGHGIYPDHSPDALAQYVRSIQSYSRRV
jgi:uroporphyrinogen decarboxylase